MLPPIAEQDVCQTTYARDRLTFCMPCSTIQSEGGNEV